MEKPYQRVVSEVPEGDSLDPLWDREGSRWVPF